jgi:hypothetical protein
MISFSDISDSPVRLSGNLQRQRIKPVASIWHKMSYLVTAPMRVPILSSKFNAWI